MRTAIVFALVLFGACQSGPKSPQGSSTPSSPSCQPAPCVEVCDDGQDNDGDAAADCADPDCDASCDDDGDDDGFPEGEDCDDDDPAVNPDAAEVCNGWDDNCDGLVDDDDPNLDPSGRSPWFRDGDGDGFGDPDRSQDACAAPAGSVADDTDCNDNNPALTPEDLDFDGSSTCTGDCDDADPTLDGNDVDGDGASLCDGDCDDTDPLVESRDADNDGFSTCDGDCDDASAALHPDDADGDGLSSCDGDCNDNDATINPGAYDVPGDCRDNDCDGYVGDVGCATWLWAVRETDDVVVRIDPATLQITDIGPLGVTFEFGNLAYDAASGVMWMIDGRGAEALYTVDLVTGAATLVGPHGITDLFGLAVSPTGTLYGSGESPTGLYEMDRVTGAAVLIGDPGLAADGLTWDITRSQLVGLAAGSGEIHALDPLTGSTTVLATPGWINNCGLAYDEVRDVYWAIDWNGILYQYDPNNGYAQTQVLAGLPPHDGLTFGP